MIIRICSFTEAGKGLAYKISDLLDKDIVEFSENYENIDDFIKEAFLQRSALIFIGACGIAVRKLAPFINNKLTDSPVLVIDEKGSFVIPILSGHMGGANELANTLAKMLDSKAVITTASDINSKFAVDIFAKKNGLLINDMSKIKLINSRALKDERLSFSINPRIELLNKPDFPYELLEYPPKGEVNILIDFDNSYEKYADIFLGCKEYIIGIGCKKGTEEKKIESKVFSLISQNKIDENKLFALASIDLKQKEYGLLLFAMKNGLEFKTYSSEELMSLEGDFSKSAFVLDKTGADNVCERAAMAMAGKGGELLIKKQSLDGITLALAKRRIRLLF